MSALLYPSSPWLFRQVQAALDDRPVPPDPTLAEQRDSLLHHYDLVVRRFGVEKGTLLMRKYACRYAVGRPGVRTFRDRAARVRSPQEFAKVVESFFPKSVSVNAEDAEKRRAAGTEKQ